MLVQTDDKRKQIGQTLRDKWANDPEFRERQTQAIRDGKKKARLSKVMSRAMRKAWRKKGSKLRPPPAPPKKAEIQVSKNGLAGTIEFIKAKILPNVVDISFNSDGSVLLKL